MDFKTIGFFIVAIIVLFVIPYLCRSSRKRDIKTHSMYAFGQITKKTGSLKNGEHWHYEFGYKGKTYESYEPTDVAYNVHVGDFYLVNFSFSNPNHSILYYQFKLRNYMDSSKNYTDTILPKHLLIVNKK